MEQYTINSQLKECKTCAYHESGHILFAYLCGYTCTYAELLNEENTEGYTSITIINYGKDSYMASKLTDIYGNRDFFTTLPLGQKLDCIEVGQRLTKIFLGGSAAMAVYKNKGQVHIPLPMQIEYTDLIQSEFIASIINELSINEEDDLIEVVLQDTLYTLGNPNVWNAIDGLANRLLSSKQLDSNDITECIEEAGIGY